MDGWMGDGWMDIGKLLFSNILSFISCPFSQEMKNY